MTNPTRKRVVTLDDLNVLNQNAAYARQKGEEASAAAQQADTARQNLEALGGDTQAAGQQATQAAQAATLAKNSATAAALQASQAAGDAVTAAELAEGAAGSANQAAGAATTAAQRVTDAVLDLTDIKVDVAQTQAGLQAAAAGAVPYATFGAFPAATAYNGKSAWATDTGFVYLSNGAAWEKAGEVATPADVQAASTTAAAALSQVADRTATAVATAAIGLHFSSAIRDGADWHPELNYGAIRLWDAGVAWRHLEGASKGAWTWTLLDTLVTRARAANLEIMLTLGQAPDWATGDSNGGNSFGSNYNAQNPTSIQDWRDYVTAVVTRYKGRIQQYEIWNEVNLAGFWSGTAAQMATLSAEAYTIIKAIDPAALVVSANTTGDAGGNGPAYLDLLLAAGAGPYCDVLGVHLYTAPFEPENKLDQMRAYREVMARYGVSKPVWNTEDTYSSYYTPLGVYTANSDLPDELAVAYLTRTLLCSLAGGAERIYYYVLTPGSGGFNKIPLLSGASLTPAGQAFAALAADLRGAQINSFEQVAGRYTLKLTRVDGQPLAYSWTRDGGVSEIINTDGAVAQAQLGVATASAASGTVPLSRMPTRLLLSRTRRNAVTPLESSSTRRNLVSNWRFRRRGTAEAVAGWTNSAPITTYAGSDAAPGSRPITLTPTAQFQSLGQRVAYQPRAGDRLTIEIRYKLAATQASEWRLGLYYASGSRSYYGRAGVGTELFLPASPDWTTARAVATLPPDFNVLTNDLTLQLMNLKSSAWNALHTEYVVVYVEQPDGAGDAVRRFQLRLYPTEGTWYIGDRIEFTEASAITTYGPEIACTQEGTLGALVGVTGSLTAGQTGLTTDSDNALAVGAVITVSGSAKRYVVVSQTSARVYILHTTADATLASATIAHSAPVFRVVGSQYTLPDYLPTKADGGPPDARTSLLGPTRYLIPHPNRIANTSGELGLDSWTITGTVISTMTTGGRAFEGSGVFEAYADGQIWRDSKTAYSTLEMMVSTGGQYRIELLDASKNLVTLVQDWTAVSGYATLVTTIPLLSANASGFVRIRVKGTGQTQWRNAGVWFGLPGFPNAHLIESMTRLYAIATRKAAALTATVPANTALTASAAYTQAEITAIINRQEQLRLRLADLEAKLAAAGLAT